MQNDAASRVRARAWTLGTIVALESLSGCIGASPTSATFKPSAIIVPDAVTIGVGEAQIFNVQYATVERFVVSADGQSWSDCIDVDGAFTAHNSIRLVARARCRGLVFVSASIGDGRSPLVAVMKVR